MLSMINDMLSKPALIPPGHQSHRGGMSHRVPGKGVTSPASPPPSRCSIRRKTKGYTLRPRPETASYCIIQAGMYSIYDASYISCDEPKARRKINMARNDAITYYKVFEWHDIWLIMCSQARQLHLQPFQNKVSAIVKFCN